jgi:cyclic pyranopterin phosphate synthase
MPVTGIPRLPHSEILTYEEIEAIVKTAVEMGIQKVRLTGGEPLIRRDLLKLVKALRSFPELEEISLTTNGFLLEGLAGSLKEAGLDRINVSLDTLQPDKFTRITRGGSFDQAWQGILEAERVGLSPVKINAVVVRGVNDDELINLARLSVDHPWQIRFIELMPVGNQVDWGPGFPQVSKRYMSIQEIHQVLDPLQLQPIDIVNGNGPAKVFQIPGSLGTVGFISPLGEHFCSSCNRLRLTADGHLRPCLLIDKELNIRDILRAGGDIRPYILKAIDEKPEGHELEANILPTLRKMIDIGG